MSRQRRFLTCSWNQVDLCQGAVCLLGRTRREGFYFRRCGVRSDGPVKRRTHLGRAPGVRNKSAGRVFRTQASGPKHSAATERPHRYLNGDLWKRSDCALLERLCCFCWRKRATHSPRAGVRSENETQKLAPGASGPPRGSRPSPVPDGRRRSTPQGTPGSADAARHRKFLRVAGNNAPTPGVTVSAGGGEATCRLAG